MGQAAGSLGFAVQVPVTGKSLQTPSEGQGCKRPAGSNCVTISHPRTNGAHARVTLAGWTQAVFWWFPLPAHSFPDPVRAPVVASHLVICVHWGLISFSSEAFLFFPQPPTSPHRAGLGIGTAWISRLMRAGAGAVRSRLAAGSWVCHPGTGSHGLLRGSPQSGIRCLVAPTLRWFGGEDEGGCG